MIEKTNDQLLVQDDQQSFKAEHSLYAFGGPQAINFGHDKIIEDVISYSGEDVEDAAVMKKIKDFRKQGSSVLNYRGKLPYGSEIAFEHTYRYRTGRLRVTTDINIPGGAAIDRHFGIGSLFLPGKWEKFFVMPPAQHQVEGHGPYTRKVDKYDGKKKMLAHWHRPPLAIVFTRKNGTSVEIGTGSDLWRWEKNFGYHSESGSYKVMLHDDGIEIVREPLACCESFKPEAGQYRYSWHLAWDQEKVEKGKKMPSFKYCELDKDGRVDLSPYKEEKDAYYVSIDLNEIEWPENFNRANSPIEYVLGETGDVSWMNSSFITRMRKIARQLIENPMIKGLRIKNLYPGISYHSGHVNKKDPMGTVHWDINGLMDFCAWFKDKAGDDLEIFADIDEDWNIPSIRGLFK